MPQTRYHSFFLANFLKNGLKVQLQKNNIHCKFTIFSIAKYKRDILELSRLQSSNYVILASQVKSG